MENHGLPTHAQEKAIENGDDIFQVVIAPVQDIHYDHVILVVLQTNHFD
jgi:hypothetical protein